MGNPTAQPPKRGRKKNLANRKPKSEAVKKKARSLSPKPTSGVASVTPPPPSSRRSRPARRASTGQLENNHVTSPVARRSSTGGLVAGLTEEQRQRQQAVEEYLLASDSDDELGIQTGVLCLSPILTTKEILVTMSGNWMRKMRYFRWSHS
ncbi:hypothetical protein SEMRO_891_G216810.1 [Seminavis robusta]|uniref:Uncharacterized protein n=1 Tax=Seminavis robusta TaxID=568900 RepID=A0A9N8ECU2_9STRA|nr:hypothetical protein SEMRO_891_G216810.1 [Seminavis robusta]|eukprot:Sro891_g216810.1 n/a (151) ;mRNA; f:17999-18451